MPWHPTLSDLRTVLATLYPSIDDARRVVVDAGLDPLHIAFDAKAITNWQHILEEALRSNRVAALLDVARQDYPANPELAAQDLSALPSTAAQDPQPRPTPTTATQIQTSGGMVISGEVTLEAGDLVGRDKHVHGDEVHGDKVAGDKIVNIYITPAQRPPEPVAPPAATERVLRPFEPETVLIPAGPFWMGSDDGPPNERPRHQVMLAAYQIGKYPITNAQYAEFLRQNPKQAEPPKAGWFLRKPAQSKEQHPAVGVSWHDAAAYCAWLSQATGRTYRLPSETEWEKAARGPDGRRYPWGDAWEENRANVNSSGATAVDRFPVGVSPYGCFDLLGNVQEWTSTLWDAADPASGYVVRGGSFRSQPAAVRCSARDSIHPDSKVNWRGFRVVLL